MHTEQYKGFIIEESNSHGKAGKSLKLSSSIFIKRKLDRGTRIMASKRFLVGDPKSKYLAIRRAKKFVDEYIEKNSEGQKEVGSKPGQTAQRIEVRKESGVRNIPTHLIPAPTMVEHEGWRFYNQIHRIGAETERNREYYHEFIDLDDQAYFNEHLSVLKKRVRHIINQWENEAAH